MEVEGQHSSTCRGQADLHWARASFPLVSTVAWLLGDRRRPPAAAGRTIHGRRNRVVQLARWEYGRVRARQWLRNACRVDPGGAAIGFFYRDTAAHSKLDASFSAKAAFSGERLGTLREGRRGEGAQRPHRPVWASGPGPARGPMNWSESGQGSNSRGEAAALVRGRTGAAGGSQHPQLTLWEEPNSRVKR